MKRDDETAPPGNRKARMAVRLRAVPITCVALFYPSLFLAPAAAQIVDSTGDVEIIDPPPSVKPGDLTSKDYAFVFEERRGVELSGSIDADAVNPGRYAANGALHDPTVPAGTWLSSYYLHFDPPGLGTSSVSGSVTFDRRILAVIERDGKLRDSNTLGASGTDYPGFLSDRGYELDDEEWFEISDDQFRLSFQCQALLGVDDLRVLTEGPGPDDPVCRIELVAVCDTSGSMNDEWQHYMDAFKALPDVAREMQIDLRTELYGIVKNIGIDPHENVLDVYGPDVPGTARMLDDCGEGASLEDWADGAAVIADEYAWHPGYRRVIVPISDDAPLQFALPGCYSQPVSPCSTDNEAAIMNAAQQCNENGVTCWPMLGTFVDDGEACIRAWADTLAHLAGGVAFDSSVPGYDYLAGFVTVLEGACTCSAPFVRYRFDQPDLGLDSSWKGNHGQAIASTATTGRYGGGLFVDGWNELPEFTAHSSHLDLLGELSICAWIMPIGPHTPDGQPANCRDGTIITKGGNYWFQVRPNNDGLLFQNTYSGLEAASVDVPIPVGSWTHVAAVRTLEQSGYHVAFYVNGNLVPGVETLGETPLPNSEPLTLGMASLSSPEACEFNGVLDEVMVYGCALTAEQVHEVSRFFSVYPQRVNTGLKNWYLLHY